MKKRFQTAGHRNLNMNSKTYALRRQVIGLINEIKEFCPNLPRIDVRITEVDNKNRLGTAWMNEGVIWIPETTVAMGLDELRATVYHEVLHAAYGVEHNTFCPLMSPYHTYSLTKEQCKKYFKKWVK